METGESSMVCVVLQTERIFFCRGLKLTVHTIAMGAEYPHNRPTNSTRRQQAEVRHGFNREARKAVRQL